MTGKSAEPLEWWEVMQVNILEAQGFTTEAARFREHPDEWRDFREQLRKAVASDRKECT